MKKHPGGSRSIKASVRKKTETLPGGRFPMPDKSHARAALQDIPKAKGLTSEDKAKIRSRAERMLGHETAGTKKAKSAFNRMKKKHA